MKNKYGIFGAALAALFLCLGSSSADSGNIITDAYLQIPPVAVVGSTFSFRATAFDWSSAEIVATSATVTPETFLPGSISSGILTVNSFTALSSATASGKITVTTNANTSTATISGGGYGLGNFSISNPSQWTTDPAASSGTACSIATALNTYTMIIATCTWGQATGVVFTTAPYYGSAWNQFQINASTPALSITTQLAGGQDNQTLSINGVTLTANKDFFPITSVTVTARSIVAAINASSTTMGVTAGNAAGVITTTSTMVGANTNYATASSSQNALTLSPPNTVTQPSATGFMFDGTNPAYSSGSAVITLSSANVFGTGQQVWLTTSTNSGGIAPLAYGATYYVINMAPFNAANTQIQLALTSTGSIAGLGVVILSSQSANPPPVYTLNAEPITGTPAVQWVASNDNVNWVPYTATPFNITISPVTYSAFFSSGTVNTFDFGHYNYAFIGLNYKAPTTGGMNLNVRMVGNAP